VDSMTVTLCTLRSRMVWSLSVQNSFPARAFHAAISRSASCVVRISRAEAMSAVAMPEYELDKSQSLPRARERQAQAQRQARAFCAFLFLLTIK